ncbi:hypothetical protein D9M70_585540 [compost metagenome]
MKVLRRPWTVNFTPNFSFGSAMWPLLLSAGNTQGESGKKVLACSHCWRSLSSSIRKSDSGSLNARASPPLGLGISKALFVQSICSQRTAAALSRRRPVNRTKRR